MLKLKSVVQQKICKRSERQVINGMNIFTAYTIDKRPVSRIRVCVPLCTHTHTNAYIHIHKCIYTGTQNSCK